MKNKILYVTTVLIWGSTWLAIEYQLGSVAVEVSLAYRFALAALIMWIYCWWQKVPMKFSTRNHIFIALLALGNFSINYVVLYYAQNYLTSAMTSIAFSTLLLMNIVNTRLFFGKSIALRTYLGAVLGVLGIVALFWNDLKSVHMGSESLWGLGLALVGTVIASLGNMVSVRNSNVGMNIFATNAWGMLYGSIGLAGFAYISGVEFTFSFELSYLLSLLYLAVFGSVIAFASYFSLLKNLGPEKASYLIVLFPIVAVILSGIFEGFEWTANIFLGLVLVLTGNVIVLTSKAKVQKFIQRFVLRSKQIEIECL